MVAAWQSAWPRQESVPLAHLNSASCPSRFVPPDGLPRLAISADLGCCAVRSRQIGDGADLDNRCGSDTAAHARRRQAIELARRFGDREAEMHALNNVGLVLAWEGELAEGRARLTQSLDMALADDAHEHAARAYANLGGSHIERRSFREADRYLRAGISYCTKIGKSPNGAPGPARVSWACRTTSYIPAAPSHGAVHGHAHQRRPRHVRMGSTAPLAHTERIVMPRSTVRAIREQTSA
jgi:hypothetical protein